MKAQSKNIKHDLACQLYWIL